MKRNPESPWNPAEPCELSPEEFEKQVLKWLEAAAAKEGHAADFSHQGVVEGRGGEYKIDVLVESSIFEGSKLVALVECKHQRRPVERAEVQILESKLRAVGGHKGLIFSTSGFQSGALEYAKSVGIATVTVVEHSWLYETKSATPVAAPPWLTGLVGMRLTLSSGRIGMSAVLPDRLDPLSDWLAGRDS